MSAWNPLAIATITLLALPWASGDCLTVADARTLPIGTAVRLCGVSVVCTTDLIEASLFQDFFVQDDSAALRVFGLTPEIAALLAQTGLYHKIELSGVTASFGGMFELHGPFELVDHGFMGMPAPVHTIGFDWQDGSPSAESMEAEFAWIARLRFQDAGMFEGVRNYLATDDGGQTWISVRISTSAQDIVGMPIPTGLVNLRGIFNQYDPTEPYTEGYQLLLRNRSDLWPFLAGDANFDCVVDLSDLAILLAHFGAVSDAAPADGDFDSDGDVDLSDLAVLLARFGGVCS
jgi:hypothetical protein